MEEKTCKRCGEVKPISEFYWDKRDNRPFARCKTCCYEVQTEYRKNGPKPKPDVKNRTERACSACKVVKPLSGFHKRSDKPDGHSYVCKVCEWEREKAKLAADPDRHENRKSVGRKWYAEGGGLEKTRERKGYKPLEQHRQDLAEQKRKHREYMAKWAQTDAGKRARVARHIKRRCGLTIDEYDAIYEAQEGKCRICGEWRPRYEKDRLVVDHCHRTGRFRALLCSRCNCAIGLLGEDEQTLKQAIEYLRLVCNIPGV